MRPATGSRTNVAINALRASAALLVVVFHVRTVFMVDHDAAPHSPVHSALYAITSLGAQAVIVFFVLSGFWVGGSVLRQQRDGRFRWSAFLVDRGSRLWLVMIPALVLTAVLDGLGHHWWGELSTYRGGGGYGAVVLVHPHGDSPLLFLGNVAWLGGIRVDTYGSNIALWSVGYEFWMYVIGAAVLVALVGRRARAVAVAAVVLVGGYLLSPELLVYLGTWLAGVVVAAGAGRTTALLRRLPDPAVRTLQLAAAVVTFGACVVARAKLPEYAGDYLVAAASVLLLATLTPNLPASAPVRAYARLADSSFSLYAIHTPVVVFLASALGADLPHRWRSDVGGWFGIAGVTVLLCVLAWVFAQLTERHTARVRAFLYRRLLSAPRAVPAREAAREA